MSARVATSSNGSTPSASSASDDRDRGRAGAERSVGAGVERAQRAGARTRSCHRLVHAASEAGKNGRRRRSSARVVSVVGALPVARRDAAFGRRRSRAGRARRRPRPRRARRSSTWPARDVTHVGGAPAVTSSARGTRHDLAGRALPPRGPVLGPQQLGQLLPPERARPVQHQPGHCERRLMPARVTVGRSPPSDDLAEEVEAHHVLVGSRGALRVIRTTIRLRTDGDSRTAAG